MLRVIGPVSSVVVWPAITGESGFYDVIVTDGVSTFPKYRQTAYEAACLVKDHVPCRDDVTDIEDSIRKSGS